MIVGVAVMHKGFMWSLPRPFRHNHVLKLIHDMTGEAAHEGEQGFVEYLPGSRDEMFEFLTREEAVVIAKLYGQVAAGFEPRAGKLFSEDLW